MAKHEVKCKICGIKFDLNQEQGVKCGARRYAHFDCFPEGELVPMEKAQDPDLQQLKSYISELFNKKANWAIIMKQIKDYKETKGYSYSGILKSLVFFYNIKNNPIEKANGNIAIVPYVYQQAYDYYYNLFMAQKANQNKTLTTEIKEITIKPPSMERKKYNLFDLEAFNEE